MFRNFGKKENEYSAESIFNGLRCNRVKMVKRELNNVTGEIILIQNNDESFGVEKIRIQADKYIHRKLIRQKYKCKKKRD